MKKIALGLSSLLIGAALSIGVGSNLIFNANPTNEAKAATATDVVTVSYDDFHTLNGSHPKGSGSSSAGDIAEGTVLKIIDGVVELTNIKKGSAPARWWTSDFRVYKTGEIEISIVQNANYALDSVTFKGTNVDSFSLVNTNDTNWTKNTSDPIFETNKDNVQSLIISPASNTKITSFTIGYHATAGGGTGGDTSSETGGETSEAPISTDVERLFVPLTGITQVSEGKNVLFTDENATISFKSTSGVASLTGKVNNGNILTEVQSENNPNNASLPMLFTVVDNSDGTKSFKNYQNKYFAGTGKTNIGLVGASADGTIPDNSKWNVSYTANDGTIEMSTVTLADRHLRLNGNKDEFKNYAKSGSYPGVKFYVEKAVETVQSLTITPNGVQNVYAGNTVQFSATIVPSTANFEYVLENAQPADVGTIDANGLFTANKPGSVDVVAIALDGTRCAHPAKMHVLENSVTGLTVSGTPALQRAGQPFDPTGLTFTVQMAVGSKVLASDEIATTLDFNPATILTTTTTVQATVKGTQISLAAPINVEVTVSQLYSLSFADGFGSSWGNSYGQHTDVITPNLTLKFSNAVHLNSGKVLTMPVMKEANAKITFVPTGDLALKKVTVNFAQYGTKVNTITAKAADLVTDNNEVVVDLFQAPNNASSVTYHNVTNTKRNIDFILKNGGDHVAVESIEFEFYEKLIFGNLTSVEVAKKPHKTTFYINKNIDYSGMIIKAHDDQGQVLIVPLDDPNLTYGIAPNTLLTQNHVNEYQNGKTLTISYKGMAVTNPFMIWVRSDTPINFTKLTDLSTLKVGDEIIITNIPDPMDQLSKTYAMGIPSDKSDTNRPAVEIDDAVGNNLTINRSDVNVARLILVEGTKPNTFGLLDTRYNELIDGNNIRGCYLSARNSNSNTLAINHEMDDLSSFTFALANGGITIKSYGEFDPQGVSKTKRDEIRFNSNNSLFSCYETASKMETVQVYQRESDTTDVGYLAAKFAHDYIMNSNKKNQCQSKYLLAKQAFNSLSVDVQNYFGINNIENDENYYRDYVLCARERYLAWAANQGDMEPFTGTTIVKPAASLNNTISENANLALILVSLLPLPLVIGFGLRKRKEN